MTSSLMILFQNWTKY